MNWHTFDTINNKGNSSQFQRKKMFALWLKKYTWLVYNWDANVMHCKICIKAKKSNGSPRAEILKILCSFMLLVFKDTKWPPCVYMLFVPMGMVHKFMNLGLSPEVTTFFCKWMTVPQVARLKAKWERFMVKVFWSLRI